MQIRRLLPIVIAALLVISMSANAGYTRQIAELCAAGSILREEGDIAWEAVGELAPENVLQDERRWAWARDRLAEHCGDSPPAR